MATRSLTQPDGDAATIGRMPAAVARASMFLAFDSSGDPIASPAPTGGNVVSAFMATVLDDVDAAAARVTLGVSTGTVTSVSDATNGGVSVTNGSTAATIALAPSDLLAKTAPTLSDLLIVGDAAASNAPKKSTIAQVLAAGQLGTVIVQDRKASGTAGSSLTQNTYADHDLNTLILNTVGGATAVSTPNITLPAGTYDVTAFTGAVSAAVSSSFRLRLFNTSGGAVQTDVNGNDVVSNNVTIAFAAATGLALYIRARFTLGSTNSLKFQEWTNGSGNTQGAATNGTGNTEPEVYLVAEFTKVA